MGRSLFHSFLVVSALLFLLVSQGDVKCIYDLEERCRRFLMKKRMVMWQHKRKMRENQGRFSSWTTPMPDQTLTPNLDFYSALLLDQTPSLDLNSAPHHMATKPNCS